MVLHMFLDLFVKLLSQWVILLISVFYANYHMRWVFFICQTFIGRVKLLKKIALHINILYLKIISKKSCFITYNGQLC